MTRESESAVSTGDLHRRSCDGSEKKPEVCANRTNAWTAAGAIRRLSAAEWKTGRPPTLTCFTAPESVSWTPSGTVPQQWLNAMTTPEPAADEGEQTVIAATARQTTTGIERLAVTH